MKHVLFVIHYLELGGAEMSLIGLLNSIDYSTTDVDLFLYSHRGELMEYIPPQVSLLPEIPEYAQIERPMKEVLKDGYLRIVWARLKAKWQFARYCREKHPRDGNAIFGYVAKNVTPLLPAINPEKMYDLAVSYLTPHDIVLEKVFAREKVCWVHTDYTTIDVNASLELSVWSQYDHVVSISEAVSEAFLSCFPSLKDKIILFPNIVSSKFVRERAEAFDAEPEMPRKEGLIRLLSVGRFSGQKNFDNVPDICRRIREKGVDICWYLIGFGGDEKLIRQKIADAGMVDYVRILGKKANPYPYMKACDFYVQPSRYEGSPVTIQEALALGKPVVATAFPTVKSVIQDGVNGYVVPLDNEGCATGLCAIIKEKSLI